MTGDKLDIPFNSSWQGKRLGESLAIHHSVWQIIFYASSPKDLMIMLDRFFVHLYLPCIICFITLHSFISLFSKTKNPIKKWTLKLTKQKQVFNKVLMDKFSLQDDYFLLRAAD